MATKGTVSMASAPVPAVVGVSKTLATSVRLAFQNVPVADLNTLSFVYGKSTLAPTTYGGLTNPVVSVLTPDIWSLLQFAINPADDSLYSLSAVATIIGPADAGWTVGDHVWGCLFAVASPISGSVPLATSGPLLVTA